MQQTTKTTKPIDDTYVDERFGGKPISITDRSWEKNYDPDPNVKRPNMLDMYNMGTETFKKDYSFMDPKDGKYETPSDEDYKFSWNRKKAKERRREFNYMTEDDEAD